ncbi:MAG: TonB family protein, partial [Bacteroidota bacterium]
DAIFKVVEQKPQFRGGDAEMLKFLYGNLRYPANARENGVEGTVVVKFIVEKDGSISSPEIARGIGGGLDQEALKAVQKMNGMWSPGMQRGRPVRVQFNLPLRFKLDGSVQAEEMTMTNAPIAFYDFKGFHQAKQFYSPKYEAPADRSDTLATRTDFRKTIFWQPRLEVGRNGTATVEFFNSDAISTFRATVEGIGLDGSIGRGEQRFFTQLPFGMSVKAPVNLLTGDRLLLPLTLTNNTDRQVTGKLAVVAPAGFSLQNQLSETVTLKAGETKTLYPEYLVGFDAKGGSLQVFFQANGLQDAFAQTLNVQPRGFPVAQVFGGSEKERSFKVKISDPVEGSLQASFTVHPSVLSDLTTGLERMLRQPGGCFEQTSSGNYPNVLALNLLKTTGNANPELEKRATDFLDYGYKRLLTFEIKDGGFDWFGSPPAHEALTAYGLMQFVDMQAVYPVEQALIDRTARWLLTRKDGKGGWLASKNGLHSWQQPNPVSDAYITWAMCEAGFGKEVKAELEKTIRDAQQTGDPYILALAANSLLKLGDQRSGEILSQLAALQAADGSWTGKTQSMTHSTGKNLTVETTALATLAFLNVPATLVADGKFSATKVADSAVRYLAAAKTPHGFGSTQATVL